MNGAALWLADPRRSYGQTKLDDGIYVGSESETIGHSGSKTIEAQYARRNNQAAIDES